MADYIRPTPRNPILGLLADALTGGVDWMRDPRRTQQMQGIGGLLAETGIPASVERLSYGEPLTKGSGMTTRLRPEAEAALMTLGPEAVPIGRGAMAAVKATKGLPVGAATVYHGSPYRFQRFDPTKIGSGEGAQAYGYGHYVAESPDVANRYRIGLTKPAPQLTQEIENVLPDVLKGKAPDWADAIQSGKTFGDLSALLKRPWEKTALQQKRSALEAIINRQQSGGALYTIDLPDPAIARMLDWDKPLSGQSDYIKRIIKENELDYVPEKSTGGRLLEEMNKAFDPEIVSKHLRQAGIPGIRYLDQGSRSNFRVQNTYKGEPYGEPVSFMTEKQARDYAAEQMEKGFGTNILPGTSNFVVFPGEEDLLRILSVDGGLLGR